MHLNKQILVCGLPDGCSQVAGKVLLFIISLPEEKNQAKAINSL